MNLQKLSEIARSVALAGRGTGGRNGHCFRHGAILMDRKGRVITAKHNSLKTHPKILNFSLYPNLHAEASAILSHGLDNCSGLNLLVVRVLRNGSFANSKPCASCERIIKEVGISKVYYTNQNGELTCA